MAFLRTNKRTVVEDGSGILYILIMEVDGIEVYKIGVTKRQVEERVCEILTSFWKSYRIFPRCYPKRFTKTENVYAKETMMHQYFKEYQYKPEKSFSGHTECIANVPLEEVLQAYKKCIGGIDIVKEKEEENEITDKG